MGSDPIDLSRKPVESSPMINLFRNTLYVRIKPDSLSVVHVESGNEHRDVPSLVIEQKNGKTLVVGVGREAETKCRQLNVTVANGFKHPRTLIADFTVAEQTLKYFLKRGVWSYDNPESWRKMVAEWFTSLGNERVKVSFDEVRTIDEQRLTIVTSIVTYTGYSAEGKNLRSLQNRLTWALKPEGNAVRIVHEHTSVPVGFNDKKAILLRETQSCPAKNA